MPDAMTAMLRTWVWNGTDLKFPPSPVHLPFSTHVCLSEQCIHFLQILGSVPSKYPAQMALKMLLVFNAPRSAAVLTNAVGRITTPRRVAESNSASKKAFGASFSNPPLSLIH